MYIHTSQSQTTVIVSLKLNTHTYRLREDKLLLYLTEHAQNDPW